MTFPNLLRHLGPDGFRRSGPSDRVIVDIVSDDGPTGRDTALLGHGLLKLHGYILDRSFDTVLGGFYR